MPAVCNYVRREILIGIQTFGKCSELSGTNADLRESNGTLQSVCALSVFFLNKFGTLQSVCALSVFF